MRKAAILMAMIGGLSGAEAIERVVEASTDVAPVWAGTPVGFALLTAGKTQYVAFYDTDRRMTVASRALDQDQWRFVKLPEQVGWDSHNYIAMAIDDDGNLHVSGNMHVVPLVYFRTDKPGDIDTLTRQTNMVGDREDRCTYPRFLRGPKGEFLFTYRDGKSGNGDQIYNVYDHSSKAWRRFLDAPLTAGDNQRNAYLNGPVKGPDGYFHLCWVWRDTPQAETNHDLSYARSKDMIHWEKGDGAPLKLPITLETADIVDPVPVKGGLLYTRIGFDLDNRVVISYTKYDATGVNQAYNARLEDGKWRVYQTTSDWDYRWDIRGGGSIGDNCGPRVSVGAVRKQDGKLVQSFEHPTKGSGIWLLDPASLAPRGLVKAPPPGPWDALSKPQSDFPGMQVNVVGDSGASGQGGVSYLLRWETLGANRDRPREGDLPAPTMLRVYKLRTVK